MIGDPFSQWWDSSGRPAIVKKISGIGKDIVKAGGNWFKESIKDLLPGGDKAGIEDYLAGALALKIGSGLFKKGMTLTDLITGGSGGSGNPLGSSIGLMNVSASVVNVNGGLALETVELLSHQLAVELHRRQHSRQDQQGHRVAYLAWVDLVLH